MAIRHVARIDKDNKVTVEIYDEKSTMERICGNDSLGYFIAETCARYMDKYVPMDTGMLAQTYTTRPFTVTYEQPYAHRLYNGDGFNFNKEKHPLATSHWDKFMQDADGKKIADEVTEYIRRFG